MNEMNEGAVAPEEVVVTATETEQVEQPVENEIVKEPVVEKKFSQEELDAVVQKRLAREQRKWDRERNTQTQNVSVDAKGDLKLTDFDTPEDYADALATRKAEQLLAAREQQKHHVELAEAYTEREERVRDKYDDFEQVAYNPKVPITEAMAATIKAADNGPEVAYFLGQNLDEAKRISKLPVYQQPYEIGKIEARLAAAPPVKKTTSAPAPIVPVSSKSSGIPSFNTTDPRSIKTMSPSDWIKAEETRLRKMRTS
jgi:hypothetical protein